MPSFHPGTLDPELLLMLVMSAAAFAQALTGFGFAIVAVGALSAEPWLVNSQLYPLITPLAATLGAVVGFLLLLPRREELVWSEIMPLLVPCTVFTPLGVWGATVVSPAVATKALAALILVFVAYTALGMLGVESVPADCESEFCDPLIDPQPPPLASPVAGYALGAMAGVFGGAFDVQGPPLVLYGNARGWSPTRFRDNVLSVVACNSLLVVALAQQAGTLRDFYYGYFGLTSLPGVLLGVWLGQRVAQAIDPVAFKQLVLLLCLGLGIKLGLA